MLHCFIICLGHHCPLHPVVCRAAANFRHLCLSVASLVTDPKVFCLVLSLLSTALLHDVLGLPPFSCLLGPVHSFSSFVIFSGQKYSKYSAQACGVKWSQFEEVCLYNSPTFWSIQESRHNTALVKLQLGACALFCRPLDVDRSALCVPLFTALWRHHAAQVCEVVFGVVFNLWSQLEQSFPY